MGYKLASHDSMTYLQPKQWYLYPFRFMARCQSKSIEEQYEKYGIRYFDLRVRYTDLGEIEFAHGLMSFKGDVRKVLDYLNSFNEEVWVRFLLEITDNDLVVFQEENFIRDCEMFELLFPNLKFHNGRRKFDWKVVYKFKNEEPTLDQKVSSMTWKIFDDWCPWFYAKLMNKKNLANGTDKDYLMLDFLHIQ